MVAFTHTVKSTAHALAGVKRKVLCPAYPAGSAPQFQLAEPIVPLFTVTLTDFTSHLDTIRAQHSVPWGFPILILSQQFIGAWQSIWKDLSQTCPLVKFIINISETPGAVALTQTFISRIQLVAGNVKLLSPAYPGGTAPQFQFTEARVPLVTCTVIELTSQVVVIFAQQLPTVGN
jgi:hypothetical protein